ncbi:MAG: thymidylate synthase [Candidatus Wolfebacteria bacterium]|nr:thymidylate synthase [Candidatus Wolfebacteria bacterium]
MDWPIYFKNNLYIGDAESSVGVATLWTKKELIGEHLDKARYNLVGQLYSKKGINYIIRNILAKPNIRHMVICGSDLSGSGQAFINLIEKGLDENNKIIGVADAYIEKEISREALEKFRKNVEIIDLREEQDPNKVQSTIQKYDKEGQFTEPKTFPEPEPPKTERFPSDPAIFKIRGEKVADVWVDVLKNIMRFGVLKTTHYDDDMRELMGVTTVITNEDPDNPHLPDWLLGLKKEELFQYYDQYLTTHVHPGAPYGYGNRMRDMRGKNQIEFIINRLKEEKDDRGACAVTWNADVDLGIKSRPCVLLIQALVQDDRLHLISYIRSNDMYQAWPRNNFALLKVQKEISGATSIPRGDLVVISASAHIYKKDWEDAERIIKKENKLRCIPDPRGNVIIAVNQEKGIIELSLLSPRGEIVAQMEAKDSVEAMDKIQLYDWISMTGHAIDIGKQLGWADLALKYGFDFRQDNMPKLEEICGKDMSAKRDIRSGSGAQLGDIRKLEKNDMNVCEPDADGNNTCA